MPADKAYIPSQLPHPNPPGKAIPFDISLQHATEDQLAAFMRFRKCSKDAIPTEAARYKGELQDDKIRKWARDHFELRLKGLKFPVNDSHWNSWGGFFLENGPDQQSKISSNLAFAFEHLLCGFFLPLNYLYGASIGTFLGGEQISLSLALYGDIGSNIVACVLCILSYILNRNLTLEQYERSIWPLVLMHHVASGLLSFTALYLGESLTADQWVITSECLIALLGTTGAYHLLVVPFDLSPLYDHKMLKFLSQLFIAMSMLWFRGAYWIVICYKMCLAAYVTSGTALTVCIIATLLLFTAFNFDFLKYHVKNTRSAYRNIQRDTKTD